MLFTHIALWLAVLLEGIIIIGLLQKIERLSETFAPNNPTQSHSTSHSVAMSVPTVLIADMRSHNTFWLSEAVVGRSAILLLSTECATCFDIARQLGAFPERILDSLLVYLHGDERACTTIASAMPKRVRVVRRMRDDVAKELGIHQFPTALLHRDGLLGAATPLSSASDISSLALTGFVSSP